MEARFAFCSPSFKSPGPKIPSPSLDSPRPVFLAPVLVSHPVSPSPDARIPGAIGYWCKGRVCNFFSCAKRHVTGYARLREAHIVSEKLWRPLAPIDAPGIVHRIGDGLTGWEAVRTVDTCLCVYDALASSDYAVELLTFAVRGRPVPKCV